MTRIVYRSILILIISASSLSGCGGADATGPRYAVTVNPLGAILRELTEGRAETTVILPPGASPHAYEPKPSDARRCAQALGLFYVAENLDGWAARLPAEARVGVLDCVPENLRLDLVLRSDDEGHGHASGEVDPHFWSDPLAVKAALPCLTDRLCALDPDGVSIYRANQARFERELDALHAELTEQMAPLRGSAFVMFHPSWNYFFHRYGLKVAGVLETAPGAEPGPKSLASLRKSMEEAGVLAVLTEPQASRRPVEALAEGTSIPIAELDPLGAGEGGMTYAGLVRRNAQVLAGTAR